MKIAIVIPTLTRHDLLKRLLQSVYSQTRKVDDVFIIDNANGDLPLSIINELKTEKANGNIGGYTLVHSANLGVAKSWNRGLFEYQTDRILSSEDWLVAICNDDNVLKEYAIEELENLALSNMNNGFFGSATNGFSFFALRPSIALETVGEFDEGFYPAYYEDNDYHYRMKLNNVDFILADKELYDLGVDGNASQTLNGDATPGIIKDYINHGFMSNQYRFVCKWGGLPGYERFKTPFNSSDYQDKE